VQFLLGVCPWHPCLPAFGQLNQEKAGAGLAGSTAGFADGCGTLIAEIPLNMI
jgi:hypothetical protein